MKFAAAFLALMLTGAYGKNPNVLFICVDDMNDFPAFAGRYPDAKTPRMDRLAEDGLVFTNAHAQFPLCGPSRSSFMSGLLPNTLGYENNVQNDKVVQRRVRELGSQLLHSYFAEHGYKTLAVGKIMHRHVPKGSVDASGGRGSFWGGTGKIAENWHQNGTSTDWAMVPERDEQLPDYDAASWAIDHLKENHEQPFFMMVGFLRPHVPWYVPEKWWDLYDRDALTLPPYKKDDLDDVPAMALETSFLPQMPRTEWAIEKNQWRKILQAYLASISFVDHQVGRVLDALADSPHADNTIIVLFSDHGYHIGEKNTFQKHSLWERSSHVPLVFAGPGIEGARRSGRVVGLIDIYPTLLELCNLPANPGNEGRSLLPLFDDPGAQWPYPALTMWKQDSFALQSENYRYIRYGDGSEELYNHQQDLEEHHNLAKEPAYQSERQRFSALLDQHLQQRE